MTPKENFTVDIVTIIDRETLNETYYVGKACFYQTEPE